MSNNSDIKQKVINTFKEVLNSYPKNPFEASKLDSEYRLLQTYNINEEKVYLAYKISSYHRLTKAVENLYPGQIDMGLVFKYVSEILQEWFELNEFKKAKNNPNQELERLAEKFIRNLEVKIKPNLVFLPIEGLEIDSPQGGLPLGNCLLFGNEATSDFMKLVRPEEEQPEANQRVFTLEKVEIDKIKAYFTYQITAHTQRAIERGEEEANLGLNILRLYKSSYYFHGNRDGIVRRMGLYGSLYTDGHSLVLATDLTRQGKQYPVTRQSLSAYEPMKVNAQFVNNMQVNGLNEINHLLKFSQKDNDIGNRFLRAITWYSKATYAYSVADSYLMYAIAIEALLSENRTPKETYANRIASLITSHKNDEWISPIGGHISSKFAEEFKKAKPGYERFKVIYSKVVELFGYRNDIAHGSVLDTEIEGIVLLDFETIVRNSILAFLKGGWNSFDDFKKWSEAQTNRWLLRAWWENLNKVV